MSHPGESSAVSTPEPTRSVAMTPGTAVEDDSQSILTMEHRGPRSFTVAKAVVEEALTKPYDRNAADPVYRSLRIYSLDPAEGRVLGRTATIRIPYEPLAERRLQGEVFEVDPKDYANGRDYAPALLNDHKVLLENGYAPSPSEPRFHQQMVYAVCTTVYAAFRTALGRVVSWSFPRGGLTQQRRLMLRPFALDRANAYYDKQEGTLNFGYFEAEKNVPAPYLPCGVVHTSLSHDIIAHEVTHALLDALRSRFDVPTRADVPAFHEGFADLVAILQHFSYSEVVEEGLSASRGDLRRSRVLWDLATQFGQTAGGGTALRTGLDTVGGYGKPKLFNPTDEEHVLGSVLVSSVFEAFTRIYNLKVARYLRAATGGSGVLPEGRVQSDLLGILAEEAAQLAAQFLRMCIRAIDYCPPVDLEFGEFLRAVITADYDLVPDDPWGYRSAWIEAFGRRRVFPRRVPTLSMDALLWHPPDIGITKIENLTFARLKFAGDPGQPASGKELRRQAKALGEFVTRPENLDAFGLAREGDAKLKGDPVGPPRVHSIRSSRRVGPDGQVVFDLVAEVIQTRRSRDVTSGAEFDFYGGSTIILGPDGEVRYIIAKGVTGAERLEEQRRFIATRGEQYWRREGNWRNPRADLFQYMHRRASLGGP